MSVSSVLNFYYEGKENQYGLGIDMYRLNTTHLKEDKVYLIFSEGHVEAHRVIDYLRYVTFSNALHKMQFETKNFRGLEFQAVSLPKEYTEACQNIAKQYKLRCSHISQAALSVGFGVVIPSSEKILVIRGPFSEKEQRKEVQNLKYIGAALDRLGVD